MIVTTHAALRYAERIAPHLTIEQARAAIEQHRPAVERAFAFGCRAVLTGAGARLVLEDAPLGGVAVVTVKNTHRRQGPVPRVMLKRFGKARRAQG